MNSLCLGKEARGEDRALIIGVDEVGCDMLKRSGDGISQLQAQTGE